VIKKEAENFLKYKDLKLEIQRMWDVRAKVIQVTIGATGNISKVIQVIIWANRTISKVIQVTIGATGTISKVIPVTIGATGTISKVIPVTIRATGTISESLGIYLCNVPGKHEIKELQKTAILDTAHKLREVLM
jgi:hypothetical protein